MTVNPLPKRKGASVAEVVCDECGKTEIVPCHYAGKEAHRYPNETEAVAKVKRLGWAKVRNVLRCGSCEAKRKASKVIKIKPDKDKSQGVTMSDAGDSVASVASVADTREPTKFERREIMKMLEDVYDVEAERYTNNDTDETVASVLNVMPGWVTEIREDFFGPDGSNEDMDKLAPQVEGWLSEIDAFTRDLENTKAKLERLKGQGKTLQLQLDKIRKAVGPRVLQKSGIN